MNKEKKYIIFGIVMIVVLLIGFTYAFYQSEMNSNNSKVTVDTDDMRIIFTNGDAIEASDVYAEDNLDIVKTFSVENKTKNEYKYNIVIEDLVNTFKTTGYLVYKITSDDGGYNMTDFIDIPKSLTATNTILAYSVTIPAKSIQNYSIEIKYINSETENQDEDQGATLSGKLYIGKGTEPVPDFISKILRDNPTIEERTDFSVTNVANTTGTIYKTNKTEDGSDVYYYSGNTTNNWVKFGKDEIQECTYNGEQVQYGIYNDEKDYYKEVRRVASSEECVSTNVCSDDYYGPIIGLTEEQCTNNNGIAGTWTTDKATAGSKVEKDIYWRIIHTNEDKSVRLLYSGFDPATTKGYIGGSAFNLSYNDPMYVGYMYGTSGSLDSNRTNTNDSTIKTFIDNWYEDTLLTNYDKYISKTAIYCNDRSVPNNNYSTSSNFDYGAWTRLSNYTPTYKCGGTGTETSNNGDNTMEMDISTNPDMFSASVTSTGGNGQLKYPIALMTADEVAFAGGKYNTNLSTPYAWYVANSEGNLISNTFWWSLSPSDWAGSGDSVWYVGGSRYPGYLYGFYVRGVFGVRPSVSLDSCVTIKSGNGTPTDPYVVDETSCS